MATVPSAGDPYRHHAHQGRPFSGGRPGRCGAERTLAPPPLSVILQGIWSSPCETSTGLTLPPSLVRLDCLLGWLAPASIL